MNLKYTATQRVLTTVISSVHEENQIAIATSTESEIADHHWYVPNAIWLNLLDKLESTRSWIAKTVQLVRES